MIPLGILLVFYFWRKYRATLKNEYWLDIGRGINIESISNIDVWWYTSNMNSQVQCLIISFKIFEYFYSLYIL